MNFTKEQIFINLDFIDNLQTKQDIYCFNCIPLNYGKNENETLENLSSGTISLEQLIKEDDESKALFPDCQINNDILCIPIDSDTISDFYNLAFVYYLERPNENELGNNYLLGFVVSIKDNFGQNNVQDILSFAHNNIYFDLKSFVMQATIKPCLNNQKEKHHHIYTYDISDTTKVFDYLQASALNGKEQDGVINNSDINNQFIDNGYLYLNGSIESSRKSSYIDTPTQQLACFGINKYFQKYNASSNYSATQIDTLELNNDIIPLETPQYDGVELNFDGTIIYNGFYELALNNSAISLLASDIDPTKYVVIEIDRVARYYNEYFDANPKDILTPENGFINAGTVSTRVVRNNHIFPDGILFCHYSATTYYIYLTDAFVATHDLNRIRIFYNVTRSE